MPINDSVSPVVALGTILPKFNFFFTGEFSEKGQWRGALMLSLICAWINRWVNNREAGDLRHHRAHYDVIVMAAMGRFKPGFDISWPTFHVYLTIQAYIKKTVKGCCLIWGPSHSFSKYMLFKNELSNIASDSLVAQPPHDSENPYGLIRGLSGVLWPSKRLCLNRTENKQAR